MDIYDALKLLAVKSPEAAREAIASLRVRDPRNLAMRYVILLDRAFSDPQAEPFTAEERAALVELAEPVERVSARTYVLHVRLSEDERVEVERLADMAGCTPSEYVRSRLF